MASSGRSTHVADGTATLSHRVQESEIQGVFAHEKCLQVLVWMFDVQVPAIRRQLGRRSASDSLFTGLS